MSTATDWHAGGARIGRLMEKFECSSKVVPATCADRPDCGAVDSAALNGRPVASADGSPVPSLDASAPLYLGLVPGRNYGWGVCSRYLIDELSSRVPCRVLSEADGTAAAERLDGPLFQALTGVDFFPMFPKARGRINYGYTFFENELTRHSFENARRFNRVLAGSSWCRDRLVEGGITHSGVLLQGIDPAVFHPVAMEPRSERFVIFSGGKFELRKGQDLVLKAFKLLQDKYPDIVLVNCWYNIWPDSMKLMTQSTHIRFEYHAGPWQELMGRTYAMNGLKSERIITLDLVANESQRELYAQTDIGVFPNRCEGGTNLVLMEYMACGRPVIASNTSGHRDIVTPDNALLLDRLSDFNIVGPGGEPIARWQEPALEELVAQIEYAYHHRDAIGKLGQRAGEDLKRFTWADTARRLLEQIDQTLAEDGLASQGPRPPA
jgi:glycosyltransferase involved in cell wall biosynthesis